MEMGGTCGMYGEMRVVCRYLVGKHDGKSHFKTRHKWESKTTMVSQEVG
jgi:hypothetical protein